MGRSRTRKLRPRAPMFPFAANEQTEVSEILSDIQSKTLPNLTNEVTPIPNLEPESMNHHDSMCFLKIIGNIQNGQKLKHSSTNPNQPISIDQNQWNSSFSRWWNGDSRTESVKVLRSQFKQVFNNIDEAYEQHKKNLSIRNAFHRSPKDILLDYARELTGAEKGLRHLCHTYKHDIPISSELQVMLESVSIRKQTIDNMFTIRTDN